MTACTRCQGQMLRDFDGPVCLQCGGRPPVKPLPYLGPKR